jgi:hypothetical protein
MKRLRHPITSLREPFGKAGLAVAILALVLALVGGAYAAGGLTKSQEKQVTKIAKKYAGKPGATGAPGAAGTNGTNGKDGASGTNGTNGKGVVIAAPASPGCPAGGKSIEVEGSGVKSNICNGNPAQYPQELPSGHTLTGHWAASGFGSAGFPNPGTGHVVGAVSYPISLAAVPAGPNQHFIKEGEAPPTGCSGTPEEPQADPGNLCIFTQTEINVQNFNPIQSIDKTGFVYSDFTAAAGSAIIIGTWAVTAE